MLFDLSIGKILVLGVIALVLFGPHELPRRAAQAGRLLRDLRRMADKARADLRQGLGPEFADFDIADLHPRTFVRKHLLDDLRDLGDFDGLRDPLSAHSLGLGATRTGRVLPEGVQPPFDSEAT